MPLALQRSQPPTRPPSPSQPHPPPQQHLLLERAPDRGTVAVAVNGSAIYLGSAIGSALFGYALHAGLSVSALPPIAAAVSGLALLLYLAVVAPRQRR